MGNDPIVAETRELRDPIARRHNYDVSALGEYFKGKSAENARALIEKAVKANDAEAKSVHEPNAPLMSADDAVADGQRMNELLEHKRQAASQMVATERPMKDDKADWLTFCEAALRVGNFKSFDQIILQALDAWFKQLPSDLRWDIAIELYTNERISSGKAAEIAGLNYFVFLEELKAYGVKFIGAEMPEGEEREKQEALLNELISF